MESDAFKIPLRSNPSTLPNVFPTILLVQSQAFKTNRKAFLLSLFKKACLIWSIRIVSRETDESYWLSRCGQAQWFSLQSQLSGERIKGLASSTVTAPHQSSHTHSELCDCFLSFIIPDSPSAWRTYAGSRCLEFHPQRECSWDSRWPLASGSKQRNGHLLHTSDSTCIQNSDLLWHTPGKSMIKTPSEMIFHWKHALNYYYFIHYCCFSPDLTVKVLFPSLPCRSMTPMKLRSTTYCL